MENASTENRVRKAKKIGLSGAFRDDEHARQCVRRLTCLPLLPPADISNAVSDPEALVSVSNKTNKPLLRRLLQYVQKSWLLKSTIGPQRFSVNGSLQRTNNGVESFHASFRRLVKVAHPSFYAFVEYSQEVTLSNMADVQRLNTSRRIRDSLHNIHQAVTLLYSFLSSVCHCSESVTNV